MTQDEFPWSAPLVVASLKPNKVHQVSIRPEAQICAALARHLDIDGLRKLSLTGTLRASGQRDWLFEGQLGATVVQPCSVSLVPVTTRLDGPVRRLFQAEAPQFEPGGEFEMPDDDSIEPLGPVIDPGLIMAEALALALPDYPRAPEAELRQSQFAAKGVAPMTDDDARPFAGLAALRDTLPKRPTESD